MGQVRCTKADKKTQARYTNRDRSRQIQMSFSGHNILSKPICTANTATRRWWQLLICVPVTKLEAFIPKERNKTCSLWHTATVFLPTAQTGSKAVPKGLILLVTVSLLGESLDGDAGSSCHQRSSQQTATSVSLAEAVNSVMKYRWPLANVSSLYP